MTEAEMQRQEAVVEAVLFTMGKSVETGRLENAWQLGTKREFYDALIRVAKEPRRQVLSQVVLETLAIIAYRQPVTKMEISKIRGVSSDHAVNKLVEYGLIYEAGRLDAPGRPALFATTEEFLRRFGVDSKQDLPSVTPDQEAEIQEEVKRELNYRFGTEEGKLGEMEIAIKYFSEAIERLRYIDGKSDWVDLRAAADVSLKKGEFALIPLGIAMQLPAGYEAHVVPRSSTFKNFGILQVNSMGVIDESYGGDDDQWYFPALAVRDTEIHVNDRICQFRIMEHQPVLSFREVEKLTGENRGGFGSTGIQ